MKKILLLTLIIMALAACTSTEEKDMATVDKLSRDSDAQWWQEIGEPDSDYWWINEYEDEQSE